MQNVEPTHSTQVKHSFITLLLPLSLVGLIGNAFTFLHAIISTNTRWIILAILLFFLLTKKNISRFNGSAFGYWLLSYCAWCFFTFFWSDIPVLSFLKSSLFIVVVFILMNAGMEWARVHPWEKTLDYMGLLTGVVLLAGLMGKTTGQTIFSQSQGYHQYYEGLAVGSNMLGFLMFICQPFLIYKIVMKPKFRLFWLCLLCSSLYYLILSMSRSSLLGTMTIGICFVLGLPIRKKLGLLFTLFMVGLFVVMLSPRLISHTLHLTEELAFKNNQLDLLSSRRAAWQQSYEGAMAGGLTGVGYGVSWGYNDFHFEHGLSAVLYGREKGNSQLAIIEETGWIGFILYVAVLSALAVKMLLLSLRASHHSQKMLVHIVAGTFFGMVIQSVFEGWWDAPGSPESCYFWVLVGVILGLEKKFTQERPPLCLISN